jgi:hypothetical protein
MTFCSYLRAGTEGMDQEAFSLSVPEVFFKFLSYLSLRI